MEKHGDRFFQRILTDTEIAYCKLFSKPNFILREDLPRKRLTRKSIGTGIGKEYSWKDIEILNDNKKENPLSIIRKITSFPNLNLK